jgi:peptide/nickel transport system substrate-binding protein
MLEKGDIDIARQLGAEQLQAVSTNPDLKIDITDKSTVLYLGLNQGMKELANPKVRQAIRWLVKYDQIADTLLKRQYRAHESVLSKGSFAAVTDKPYHYDLTKAKALLAEAGYADGFKLELDVFAASPFREIAQALQSSLGEAGIKVSIIASDRRQTLTKYRARNHQAVLMVWSPDYGDPDSTMDFFLNNPDNSDASTAKTAAWRNKWFDPKLKELSDKAVLEHDGKKRTEMYTEIQHGLQTNSPFVVMFQQTEAAAMRKNVEHWLSGPSFDTYVYRGITK